MTPFRIGQLVATPSGKRARVTSIVEAGYRANLEYVPDEPTEFGEKPETVSLPVKLLEPWGKK